MQLSLRSVGARAGHEGRDATSILEELDRNADDQLSDQEWARAREEREQVDRQFSALDPNGDGKVTRDEFLNVGDQKYQSADVNADDKVSIWEYRGIRRM